MSTIGPTSLMLLNQFISELSSPIAQTPISQPIAAISSVATPTLHAVVPYQTKQVTGTTGAVVPYQAQQMMPVADVERLLAQRAHTQNGLMLQVKRTTAALQGSLAEVKENNKSLVERNKNLQLQLTKLFSLQNRQNTVHQTELEALHTEKEAALQEVSKLRALITEISLQAQNEKESAIINTAKAVAEAVKAANAAADARVAAAIAEGNAKEAKARQEGARDLAQARLEGATNLQNYQKRAIHSLTNIHSNIDFYAKIYADQKRWFPFNPTPNALQLKKMAATALEDLRT